MTDVRDHMLDAVQILVSTPEKPAQQHQAMRLLGMVWNMLPGPQRARFLSAATIDGFVTFEPIWPELDRELNMAARYWPYVVRSLGEDPDSEKDRAFAGTITKLIRMRRKPSEKQAAWMRQLYRDYRRWSDTDGEVTD